ncbi:hypothetical protein CM15mP35_03420 [bacterium]|nr:MAG: hypothetical protein CM15mP35_03420 [bacterium]
MIDGDTFTTHHRGHGIFLARGGDPDKMMAEIAGKKMVIAKVRAVNAYRRYEFRTFRSKRYSWGGIPTVVGAALSYKYLNKKMYQLLSLVMEQCNKEYFMKV